MSGKFAIIRYAKDPAEIPVKLMPLLKNNKKIINWYIGKFLPYTITDMEICNVNGYEIVLPMVDGVDSRLFQKVSEKVAENCIALGVTTVMAPDDTSAYHEFYIPSGNYVKFFLIKNIMSRYVKKSSKDFKNIETVVIEGSFYETNALISLIYNELNYLSIILEENSKADYESLADFVFGDCGLNLSFGERGSSLLKEADIIISLSQIKKGYDTHLKAGACYIELSSEKSKVESMALRRSDIAIIDNFNVETECGKMPAKLYEMLLYCKSREFSRFIQSKGRYGDSDAIFDQLRADKAVVKNLNI